MFWNMFRFHGKRHLDVVVASLILISMVGSQIFEITPVHAASYTVNWDTQSDFTSNTSSGWSPATSTIGSLVSTSTTPGSVVMVQNATTTLTENFAGTYHLDGTNSTAVVSSNLLQRTAVDTFANLTSKISSIIGNTYAIGTIVYDTDDNYLFINANLQSSWTTDKVVKYNLNTGVVTDLTSTLNPSSPVMFYDSTNRALYLEANYGQFRVYKPQTNTILTTVTANCGNSGDPAIHFDSNAHLLYYLDGTCVERSYSPSAGTGGPYASWTSSFARYMRFNPNDNYFWGPDQTSSTNGRINSTGPSNIAALTSYYIAEPVFDTDHNMTYWNSVDGDSKLYKYNGTTVTSFTYPVSGQKWNRFGSYAYYAFSFYAAEYDHYSQSIYTSSGENAGAPHSYVDKFDVNTNTFTDLSSDYNTAVGTTTVPVVAITSDGAGTVYYGSYKGDLASSTPPATSQIAQSSTLVTTATNIANAKLTATATLGTGSATYYLSNDNGTTWTPATSGTGLTFASTGTQLKYKVVLTGNTTISSISIAYDLGYTTGTLSNMKKDAGGDAQWVNIAWNATLPANTSLTFKTRGATSAEGAAALYSKSWSDAYTATTTGNGGIAIKANGSGGASLPTYRYMEVETILTSNDSISAPTLNSLTMTYAINAPPEFNSDYPTSSAGGVTASQVSDANDANWGKVKIDYSVRDPDAAAGTVDPGFITPSFSYRLTGSGSFISIDSAYLSTNATAHKAVDQSSFTTYSAYWDAKTQIPTQYANIAEVKVTVDDREIIYNLAYATSSAMTIDTTPPTTSFTNINGSNSTSTVRITASDQTTIKDYLLSNNADYSADGSNATSGAWQPVGSNTLTLSQPWTLRSSVSTSTVYVALRDIYGNVASSTIVAPATSPSFEIHDISNVSADTYKLIVAWTPFTSATGATFASYRLLRSTDGVTYSSLQTITNSTLNYYLDTTVASSTTYYYKLQTVDTDGDASAYTTVANAIPSGQGGSSLPPIISATSVSDIKNTSAKVSWTTNTLTNSTVSYGTSNSYGHTASTASYTSDHSVYLTGLLPNTTYHVKVASTDFYTNTTTDDNGGASYTFTTLGGPVISNVTVNSITDNSATIFWNSSTSSDSYVHYSVNANLTSSTLAGNGTLVSSTTSSGVYSHQVQLSGLSAATNYYFYVSSTDSDGNQTIADNDGGYYGFLTTKDVSPPTISNISVPVITKTSAVIVWSTDKPTTGQVEWGDSADTPSGSYANTSTLDTTLSPTHVIAISNLSAKTSYYFRVKSSDAAGNHATSNEETFTSADTDAPIVVISSGGGGGSSKNTTPPTINNITVNPINSFGATITVTGSSPFIAIAKYAETSSSSPSTTYDNFGSGDESFATSKNIKLSGLNPGTMYHFIVSLIDQDGNVKKSSEQTFTTKYLAEDLGSLSALDKTSNLVGKLQDILESALPSISPPFIDTPSVSNVTGQSATVSWRSNIKSFGTLAFASDKDFTVKNSYTSEIADLSEATTTHSVQLTGLTPATKYHISGHAFVFPQLIGKSADITFSTKAGVVTPEIIDIAPDTFRVIWKTDITTTSIIDYTDRKTGRTYTQKDSIFSTKHDIVANNLTPGDTYDVSAYGYDKDGLLVNMNGTLSVTTTVDTKAPTVTSLRIDSNLVPGRTDIIQSLVSWKTDKPSNSVVSYEEGSGSADQLLKNKVSNDTGYIKDHVVILPSLKPSTIYRIQVSSTDQSGNTLALPIRTIVTPQQSESIIDIIFKNFSDTFNFIGK